MRLRSARLSMSLILTVATGFGVLTSYLALRGGLHAMWLRYPLAFAVAYGVFLGLVGLWIALLGRRLRRLSTERGRGPRGADPSGLDVPGSGGWGSGGGGGWTGGGGRFGGAGASGHFEGAPPAGVALAVDSPASDAGGPFGLDLDFDFGFGLFDDVLGAVAALGFLLLVVSLLVWAAWLVWLTPVFVAELVLDGLLVAGFYRRLRTAEGPLWFSAVLKRTWPWALGVAVALAVTGYVLAGLAPGADSIGDLWR